MKNINFWLQNNILFDNKLIIYYIFIYSIYAKIYNSKEKTDRYHVGYSFDYRTTSIQK